MHLPSRVTVPASEGASCTRASLLYNGTRSLFEKAGFEFVRSTGKYNCVMRTRVKPA